MEDQEPGPSGQTELDIVMTTSTLNMILTLLCRYKRNVYGVLHDKSNNINTKSLREMVEGEERRWKQADRDQDGSLNIVEFQVIFSSQSELDESVGLYFSHFSTPRVTRGWRRWSCLR